MKLTNGFLMFMGEGTISPIHFDRVGVRLANSPCVDLKTVRLSLSKRVVGLAFSDHRRQKCAEISHGICSTENRIHEHLVRQVVHCNSPQSITGGVDLTDCPMRWSDTSNALGRILRVTIRQVSDMSEQGNDCTHSLGNLHSVLFRRKLAGGIDRNAGDDRLQQAGPDLWLPASPIQVNAELVHDPSDVPSMTLAETSIKRAGRGGDSAIQEADSRTPAADPFFAHPQFRSRP